MKRIVIVLVVVLITCGVYLVAQPMRNEPFYWQDKIARPDEAWNQGCIDVNNVTLQKLSKDDNQIAFNIRRLYAVCQQYQSAIQQLDVELTKVKKRVEVLEKSLKPVENPTTLEAKDPNS